MKNKFLIGIITFFVAIFSSILILNLFNTNFKKNNYFVRKFSKNEILKFDKEYEKLFKNSSYDLFYSNSLLLEGKYEGIKRNMKNYNFYFSDFLFSKKINKNVSIPLSANILLVDEKYILYDSKSKISRLEIKTDSIIQYDSRGIRVYSIVSLKNLPNKFLFFGEVNFTNIYKTGFFVFDITNNKIEEIKILKYSENVFNPEVRLMYSGIFQNVENNIITYTCDKNCKIFMFNDNGTLVNELKTNDNTQIPKVIKKADSYFYSRDGLNLTNSGVFSNKKNLFVFSMASQYDNIIIIDQYSKLNLKYIQSFKLDYNNHNTSDIMNIYINNNQIILKFDSSYASFIFSRFI
ncbi:hypothetical protein [Flavobacterium sp.]|uniref:hypothetical protein n=1 Tax=Flavobacterium sp. TaxID=239 RepID=UPI0037529EE7